MSERARSTLPFLQLSPALAAGGPVPDGWVPLQALPLLILVGVTGVGKSTALELLQKQIGPSTLLPDRRALTDDLIISAMQAAEGLPVAPVRDRALRFEYTRRFRELYPGGMAHALALLSVRPEAAPGLLIFDGLRGGNEIAHAAQVLPHVRFIMLDARDSTRVARLLGRNDAFDSISSTGAATGLQTNGLDALRVDGASELFSPAEVAALLALVESGQVSADALRAKIAIVLEERRNYDPAATRAALTLLPERALIVDTETAGPARVARAIAESLRVWALIGSAQGEGS